MLFLDEIHRMSRPAEEMLYLAMEDFRVDVVVGKGAGATAIPLELPPFTLVGATTRAGLLPGPLRDRFGFTGHLDFYADRGARAGRCAAPPACSASSCTTRAAGRDRPSARAARRASPTGCCAGSATGRRCGATACVDRGGRPRGPRRLRGRRARPRPARPCRARRAVPRFGGGPVGLSTLAVAVGEEPETVETVAEPFLVREGLIARTPRGRVATPRAWEHLGLDAPRDGAPTLFG